MNRFKNELIIDSNSKFGYFYAIGDEFLIRKPPLEEINNLVKSYSAHMFIKKSECDVLNWSRLRNHKTELDGYLKRTKQYSCGCHAVATEYIFEKNSYISIDVPSDFGCEFTREELEQIEKKRITEGVLL